MSDRNHQRQAKSSLHKLQPGRGKNSSISSRTLQTHTGVFDSAKMTMEMKSDLAIFRAFAKAPPKLLKTGAFA
jgi:hypothetical protein